MDSYPTLSALLCLKYQFSLDEVNKAVDDWLDRNSRKSKSDILRYIQVGLVAVEEKKLVSTIFLSLEEAQALADEIKSNRVVEIKNRWSHLKQYKKCFIGSELASWLMASKEVTEKEAIALGQNLLEHNLITHVCQDHDFKNDFFFYKFVD